MKLSPNFTLAEFTRSATATARGIPNAPPPEVVITLRRTAAGLELIRDALSQVIGRPAIMIISSGYRSLPLNRAIGSRDTSQHVKGEAADWVCPAYGDATKLVAFIARSNLPFDQLIDERDSGGARWVHTSFTAAGRGQVLSIDGNGVRQFSS